MSTARDERRWVTVMFADISGFTAMAEQMDPEDVMSMAVYVAEEMGKVVHRFGGTVLRIVGDEILAVFGAPTAHEDDAERAVRAALAIRDLELTQNLDQPIHVHIGVNTGEVLAGFMSLEGRKDYDVMGDVVNTAARLRSAAPPGSVWIGQATHEAATNSARYKALLPLDARGKEAPIEAWEALEAIEQPQARPFGTVSFIGRDRELDRLLAMWNWVSDNRQPHLVTILGEAGIGKTRLAAEFEGRLPDSVRVLHGNCLPYGAAHSYGALEMTIKEAAGITAEDETHVARTKLDNLVTGVIGPDSADGDPQEIAQHLALMSGLDVEADRRARARDERVFRVSVRRFLSALSRRQPLCLVFDNIQWADEALLDLMEHIAGRIQAGQLLILTQSRPEILESRPAWGKGVPSFTSLVLQALDDKAEKELILALCREHGLPDELANELSRNVGGNPLFAEELVAMVAEQGQDAGIPLAIKMLISARLDTLALEERRLLLVASVFGGTFWEGGLHFLSGHNVNPELGSLERKGLLRSRSRSQYPGEREFTFKHDLIHEVAYEILPKAERKVFHGKIVDWFEETAGEHVDAFFDVIAHHAVEADQHERAIKYLIRAAERAGRATAHRQETALLNEALSLAQQLGRPELMAELHVRLGQAFIDLGKWDDADRELSAALTIIDPEDVEQRISVLTDLSWARFWLVDVPGQNQAADEAMALAKDTDRDDLIAKAMFVVGFSHMNAAELESAQELCRSALSRGGDSGMMELSMAAGTSGLISFWHGKFDEAIEFQRKAIQMGHNHHHTLPTAIALPQLGLSLVADGRYKEAQEVFDQSRQFGQEYELWPFLARSQAMAAGYHLDLFDYAGHERIAMEARELGLSLSFLAPTMSASIDLLLNFARQKNVSRYEELVSGVADFVEKAPGFHGWLWRLRLAEAQAEIALVRGDWDEALRWAELGISRSREFGRVKYHALSLESRAKAKNALGRTNDAIKDLNHAVDLVRSIGDPAIFLRISTSLLVVDGNDALLAEIQATAHRIADALPDEESGRHFAASEPLQLITSLGGSDSQVGSTTKKREA